MICRRYKVQQGGAQRRIAALGIAIEE